MSNVLKVVKFGTYENLTKLQNGEVFMPRLSWFATIEDTGAGTGDGYEGTLGFPPENPYGVIATFTPPPGVSEDGQEIYDKEEIVNFQNFKLPIYSDGFAFCAAIVNEKLKKEAVQSFGEYALVINDFNKFVGRFRSGWKNHLRLKQWEAPHCPNRTECGNKCSNNGVKLEPCQYGVKVAEVQYLDGSPIDAFKFNISPDGSITNFVDITAGFLKRPSFCGQNEIRILVRNAGISMPENPSDLSDSSNSLKINIGSVEDISSLMCSSNFFSGPDFS